MQGFQLSGIDEIKKELKQLSNIKEIQKVVKANGAELQQTAMRKAPVDTGSLKRSITLDITDGGMTARINPTMEYAGCYQIARNVINYVLESVKIGGNLIVKPLFRMWNVL
jgi:hypothetical protein